MGITAKELAKELGLSATAVSMALNNKPGVSADTRSRVIREAEARGYDFSRVQKKDGTKGSVYIISYKTHDAILSYSPIFDEIWEGIRSECQKEKTPVRMMQFYEKTDDLEDCFYELRGSDCAGLIVIGTEIRQEVCRRFLSLGFPMLILDTYFDNPECSFVTINNSQGAYLATDYLISRYHCEPGHLQCSYQIPNFEERRMGFHKAVKENGLSVSRCQTHPLSPSIEGAMADFLEILDSGVKPARCYFADNDILAIGAIKALKLRGYRVPDDVAVAGFDNISEGRIIEPALTTVDVPRYYIGQTSARLLLDRIDAPVPHTAKVEIGVKLVKRFSA